jgi:ubiquinone/menaquinone biosynthesis C-methylase UbiE
MNARLAYPLLRNAAEHARLARQAAFWSADAAALFATVGVAAGSRVADLGCGTLHVAKMLARLVGRAGTVLALDSDPAVMRAAASTGRHRVQVEHGDAYAAPWRDGSLDAVHARFLAAPAGRLDALVGEMRRLVRPGGWLMLQEPVADSWHVPTAGAEWSRMLALIRAGFRHRGGDFDIGRRLAQQLQAAGASEVRTRTVVHRIAATHPYATLPLAFCDSLAPLWRRAAMVGDDELEALRGALLHTLAGADTTVTTFTLVQAWGRR